LTQSGGGPIKFVIGILAEEVSVMFRSVSQSQSSQSRSSSAQSASCGLLQRAKEIGL